MSNMLVLPILIPLCTAVILIFFKEKIRIQRGISMFSGLLSILVTGLLVARVHSEGILTLQMGGWAPPYGIVFVGDMFAVLLVMMASIVSFAILIYSFSSIEEQREKHYYYTFFHFLLVGVYGSFLTGDIFNLFVFFEVMLISSYALIALGGTKLQLRETSKYLLINIVSSTLFVAAVAYLYAAVGTLNMAHLSQRIAEAGQGGVLNVIAVLFLIVFSLKAGLLLFFWLPGSYSAPPSAIRALFGSLLTKVGLYAIIRTFTLLFVNDPELTQNLISFMAVATMVLGSIGAVAYRDIPRIINYNVIISVGFVAFGLAAGTADALNGVVFYLLHDMLAKALLFILGGLIISAAGTDRLSGMGGMMKKYPLIGWMFFILILALAGIPPLSGFVGKLLIIRGALDAGMLTLSLVALGSSFMVLYSLIKVFRLAFWGKEPEQERAVVNLRSASAVAAGLVVLIIAMGIGADAVNDYVSQARDVLVSPAQYIQAIMKE